MSDVKLIWLYRRFTRRDGGRANLPEVDTLLAANSSDATHPSAALDTLGSNGLHADLLQFSRELNAASAELSVSVSALLNNGDSAAHGRFRREPVRHAPRRFGASPQRWLRSLSGVAAVLVAGVMFWSAQHRGDVANVNSPQLPDRIFAALNEPPATDKSSDTIFRTGFHPDTIFSTTFSGG